MKKVKKLLFELGIISTICMATSLTANAEPYNNKLMTLKQPDNSEVQVKVTGDEYYQRVESLDGYTLCRNDEGWICYADKNADDSKLIASNEIYKGEDYKEETTMWDRLFKKIVPREKHLDISAEAVKEEQNKVRDELYADKSEEIDRNTLNDYVQRNFDNANRSLTRSGKDQIKGITLLIDFPDQKSAISGQEINNFINKSGYTGFNNKGSVKDFFSDVSGGVVEYTNTVVGFYTAQHPKSYYDNPNLTNYDKALELVRETLNYFKSNGFDFSKASLDKNGEIRALNLFYAGNADAGWSKGLWPHRGYIPEGFYANGVGVHNYQMTNIGSELSLSTFCHENSHLLFGFPDLYDYSGKTGGCGAYSLMSYAPDPKNPLPPDPYCRDIIGGWKSTVDLNRLNNSKVTANSSTNGTHNVFKWTNSRNSKEYYLVENIEKQGRYASMPDEGLMVWHIDENGDNSNYENSANKHYKVSVVQADNKKEVENKVNGGGYGDLFHSAYKNSFSDSTSPSARWWDNSNSGLNISNISAKGANMTFNVGNVSGGSTSSETSGNEDLINIAKGAKASTSYCSSWETIAALNDGFTPSNSADKSHGAYGNWPKTGTQWVQYNFDKSYKISRCDLYWFSDGQGVDVPSSYRIKYWTGTNWAYVNNPKGLGTSANTFNVTTFDPVVTTSIQVEFDSNGSKSTGILEWGVYGDNLARNASVRSSYCSSWEKNEAVNDGFTPANSSDKSHGVYGNWPKTGVQTVQYNFDKEYEISRCDLYWFKDGQGIDVPSSYRFLYWDGSSWQEVKNARGYGKNINGFNTTTFDKIKTQALVIEMNSNGSYSTGIIEWRVY